MEKNALIQLNDVSFGYSDWHLFKKISLTIEQGAFYIFIGPNGEGKTTLLKLIMGLLKPSEGRITIAGKSPDTMLSLIGYMPQTFLFDPLFPITVFEFVLMGALSSLSWWGRYPKSAKVRALSLLDEVGMLPHKDRSMGALSGGQRQRASLARALLSDPSILLLDEPMSGLDREASLFIQEKLKSLKGIKTILMVTHTIPDFVDVIDRAICVERGVEEISKDAICSHYTYGLYHPKTGKLS